MIHDSGERRTFSTGAVRDITDNKGRCDLMPLSVVATLLENLTGGDYIIGEIAGFTSDQNIHFKDKKYWWQLIQLLPSSYNQRRTYMFSYAALRSIYHARKNHKLDEWREFCRWIESLPYSELITNQEANDNHDEAGI